MRWLGREKDSWVCGACRRQPVIDGCWLCGNRFLFRQCDEQTLNLALLVWDGEAGLSHGDILP